MAFLAISGDGSGESVGRSVAIDGDGNAFVAGSFATSGTVDFDPDPLGEDTFSTNDRDAFLAKYDSAGSLAWIWTGGGGPAKLDDAWGVAVDGGGNPYVVGQFDGTVDFDPGPGTVGLAASGSPGADFNHFVAKYDNDGSLLWALTSGSSSLTEAAYGVAVGDDDDAYVVGAFRGTVDFDPTGATAELVSTGSPPGSDNNYFVARYDAAGSLIWAHTTGATTGNENGSAIALDWAGNVFVVGDFTGTVDFDDQAGVTTLVADNPDYTSNMFVAKYDSDGGLLWARTSDSSAGTEAAAAVAVDNDGHVFVAGWFDGTVTFDGTVLVATGADFTSNMFVAKYDINGELMWATTTGVTDNETGEYASALSVDQQDNVYVSGAFGGTVDFDPGPGVVQLVSTGESWDTNHFTAKYSPNGKLLWVTTSGSSTGSEAVDSTVLDHNGRFYATGTFIGTADFDPGPDQAIVDSGIDQSKHFLIAYDLPDGPGSPPDTTPGDTIPPAAPRIGSFVTDTGNPNDHITTDQTLIIRGTGEAGSTIRLFRSDPFKGEVLVGTAVADADGNWSVDDTRTTLPFGTYDYWTQAVDRAGNVSPLSADFPITIEQVPAWAGFGGPGSIIYGHSFSSDWVEGGSSADSIRGGAGDDTIFGREEGDRLFGDNGADRINGNKGDDELHGDDGNDVVFGGQGNDWVYGDFGDDWLNGNVGNDVVQGAAGNDTLYGGRGMDQLHGGAGNDLLSGDRGNDTMTGGVGADQFYFGAESGRDRIEDFDPAADRIAVDLDVGGAINGVAIASFEQLLARIVDTPEGAFLDLGGGHGVLLAGINKAQLTIDQFLLV